MSAREFAIDLKKFGRVTREQAQMIVRKIIIDLDTRVVLSTPVDTGRARGNWYPSIGEPSSARNDENYDPSGGGSVAAATGMAMGVKLGQLAWLTNNLPYILPLENGWSKQAPSGMVDKNLNAIAAKYGGQVIR